MGMLAIPLSSIWSDLSCEFLLHGLVLGDLGIRFCRDFKLNSKLIPAKLSNHT